MIKLKDLLNEGVFKNKDADKYLDELMDILGEPTYESDKEYGLQIQGIIILYLMVEKRIVFIW